MNISTGTRVKPTAAALSAFASDWGMPKDAHGTVIEVIDSYYAYRVEWDGDPRHENRLMASKEVEVA